MPPFASPAWPGASYEPILDPNRMRRKHPRTIRPVGSQDRTATVKLWRLVGREGFSDGGRCHRQGHRGRLRVSHDIVVGPRQIQYLPAPAMWFSERRPAAFGQLGLDYLRELPRVRAQLARDCRTVAAGDCDVLRHVDNRSARRAASG